MSFPPITTSVTKTNSVVAAPALTSVETSTTPPQIAILAKQTIATPQPTEAERKEKSAELRRKMITQFMTKLNWSVETENDLYSLPIEQAIVYQAILLFKESPNYNTLMYARYFNLICHLQEIPLHPRNGEVFDALSSAIKEADEKLAQNPELKLAIQTLKILSTSTELKGKTVAECLNIKTADQAARVPFIKPILVLNSALMLFTSYNLNSFHQTIDNGQVSQMVKFQAKLNHPGYKDLLHQALKPAALIKKSMKVFNSVNQNFTTQKSFILNGKVKNKLYNLFFISQLQTQNQLLLVHINDLLSAFFGLSGSLPEKAKLNKPKKEDGRFQNLHRLMDSTCHNISLPLPDGSYDDVTLICAKAFASIISLMEDEKTAFKDRGEIEDPDLLWTAIYDDQILNKFQPAKETTKVKKTSKKAALEVETKQEAEAVDSSSDEDNPTLTQVSSKPQSTLSLSCTQRTALLCKEVLTINSANKTALQPWQSKRLRWVKKDTAYHLQLLGSDIELVFALCSKALQHRVPALTYRLVRHISILTEQQLTTQLILQQPDKGLQHSHVEVSKDIGLFKQLLEEYQEEMENFLDSIDGGTVFHRYPYSKSTLCQSSNRPVPKTLSWLLQPKSCDTTKDLIPFLSSSYRFLELMTAQNGQPAHSHSQMITEEVAKRMKATDKPSNEVHPFSESLKKQLGASIAMINELIKLTESYVKSSQASATPSRTVTLAWQEINFHLVALREAVDLWIDFPQAKFLVSHGDQMWTHLQIIDEQSEMIFQFILTGKIVRDHNLRHYRDLRDSEETMQEKNLVDQLNADIGSHYPHFGQGVRKMDLRAIPLAVSWRLEAVELMQEADELLSFGENIDNPGKDSSKKAKDLVRRLTESRKALINVINNFTNIFRKKCDKIKEAIKSKAS